MWRGRWGVRTGKDPDCQVGYSSQKNKDWSRSCTGHKATWPLRVMRGGGGASDSTQAWLVPCKHASRSPVGLWGIVTGVGLVATQ